MVLTSLPVIIPVSVKKTRGTAVTDATVIPKNEPDNHSRIVVTRITITILRFMIILRGSFSTLVPIRSGLIGVLSLRKIMISKIQLQTVSRSAIGKANIIQPRKLIFMPNCSNSPTATAFAGVPIIVPIPPTIAARGTPNNNDFVTPEFLPNEVINGVIAAMTIAVEAELDITIDAIIVVIIKTKRSLLGFVPEMRMENWKRRSSNFVFFIASAKKKPPIMSQITLLENVFT